MSENNNNNNVDFSSFGPTFQKKIVQALIVDPKFAEQLVDILNVNFFVLQYLKVIVDKYFSYYTKYNAFPSFQLLCTIIKDEVGSEGEEGLVKKEILSYFVDIKTQPLNGDLQYVKDKALEFCKSQSLKNAMFEVVDMMDKMDYENIVSTIKKAIDVGGETDYGHEYSERLEDRLSEDNVETVATGFDVLDDKNILNGGLARGELGIVIAPTGVGKSNMLAILAANAMRQGLNVVYFTFELSEKDVGRRFDANFSGIPQNELKDFKESVKEKVSQKRGRLFIKFFPTKSATTNTLRSYIDKLAIKNFKCDLLVLDYADTMKGTRYTDTKRFELEAIYEDLRNLAGELQIPLWTASQSNRSGYNDEILEIDKAHESFAKTMVADVIITLTRRLKDRANNMGKLYIGKSRRGRDGLVFPIMLDTATVRAEIYNKLDQSLVEKMMNKGEQGVDMKEVLKSNSVQEAFAELRNKNNK
jgi:replicative DNA helicase